MFDVLTKGFKPEMLLKLLEGMLSPSQKAMMFSMPKVITNAYDLSQKPLPKMAISRKGNRLAVIYEFETEADAIQYEQAENETLNMVRMMLDEAQKKEKKDENRPAQASD
jgi:hypothetical protein